MNAKIFDTFLAEGVVRRQTPNIPRAVSLLEESKQATSFLNLSLQTIPSEKMNSNFIATSCYDIIMQLLRAHLFSNGFNAGASHEAEVSYLRVLGFPESDVVFLNELRYYRNGTKYYGTQLDREYADAVLMFMRRLARQLKEKLDSF